MIVALLLHIRCFFLSAPGFAPVSSGMHSVACMCVFRRLSSTPSRCAWSTSKAGAIGHMVVTKESGIILTLHGSYGGSTTHFQPEHKCLKLLEAVWIPAYSAREWGTYHAADWGKLREPKCPCSPRSLSRMRTTTR